MPLTQYPPMPVPPERDVKRERRILIFEIAAFVMLAIAGLLICGGFGMWLLGAGVAVGILGMGTLTLTYAAQTG